MSTFVKSLYNLYNSDPKRVTKEKLQSLVADKKISETDYEYITGEKYE